MATWNGISVTSYFLTETLQKHAEIADIPHRIREALTKPLKVEIQNDGRTRRWVHVPETGHYLRVIVEGDGETVDNAFRDRRFTPPK